MLEIAVTRQAKGSLEIWTISLSCERSSLEWVVFDEIL